MSEVDQAPTTREGTPAKEKLAYNTDFVGLRVRLLMGQELLDHSKPIPQSPEEIKKSFDQLDLRANTTYRLLTNLSTDERIKYWEKRGKEENLSQTEAQKAAWKKEVVAIFNDPTSDDYRAVFGNYKTGDINWKEFNEAEAEKLYQRYFQDSRLAPITLDGKTTYLPSSVIQYVEDILNQYIKKQEPREDGTAQATVNFEQLQKDLPTIQAFGSIFGEEYSYEILAQLIDAEIKNVIAEKQQEEINAALQKEKVGDTEKTRGDNLRSREIELLEALQKAHAYKEVVGPTPPGPTPQQGKPPSEPEDFEFEEVEKSQPLPAGYKWIYEKAFNPLKDKPDKIRTFPEEHLVEEMVRPTAIAHKLKVQDKQYALHRFDHLTEQHLAKEIEHENGILESRLAKLGLNRVQLVNILNSAMGAYRSFVEEKYKLKLPEIGEIAIKPIWGKTAQYYNPDRKSLAFIVPTVPAIFMDMDTIAQAALNLAHKPWQELPPEEFRTLIIRLLNEIRPHETTHLSSDLAFWYLDKEANSDKHKKVAVGKLGPFVVKPVGLNEEGDIITKQRGRGLMEAVTVELTNQWAKSLDSPLDIDAYKSERKVLNTLIKQMMEEQKISYDQAFTKFVEAYFTPDGFRHLAAQLSGREYATEIVTTKDGKKFRKLKGELKKPYYLSTIYALMEYEARKAMQTGSPSYSLTLSYIHNHLTDPQRQEIMALADNPPAYLTLPFIIRKHLLEQLTGVKPPPPPKPTQPPRPPEPTTPPPPGQEPIAKGEHAFKDLFVQVKGPVEKNHRYFVDSPPDTINLTPDQMEGLSVVEPFFVNIQPGSDGRIRCNPNRKVVPFAFELGAVDEQGRKNPNANQRYVNGEMATNGDSGLLALAAASAETPEKQAKLYHALIDAILKTHIRTFADAGSPTLFDRWYGVQQQGPNRWDDPTIIDSLRIFEFYDRIPDPKDPKKTILRPANERLLMYDSDGKITYMNIGFWHQRASDLQKALASGKLAPHHLRWIEFFAHSVNVPQLIEMIKSQQPERSDFEITILKPEAPLEVIDLTKKDVDKPTVIQVRPDQIPTQDQIDFRPIPYLEKLGLKAQFENWLPFANNVEILNPIELSGISHDHSRYYYQAIRKKNQDGTTQYSCLLFEKNGEVKPVGHVDFTKLANSQEAKCSSNQLEDILKTGRPPQLHPSAEKWNDPVAMEAVKIDSAFRGRGFGKTIWYLALSQAALDNVNKVNILADFTRGQRPDRPGESFYENLGADAILLFQETDGDITSSIKLSSTTYLAAQLNELTRLFTGTKKQKGQPPPEPVEPRAIQINTVEGLMNSIEAQPPDQPLNISITPNGVVSLLPHALIQGITENPTVKNLNPQIDLTATNLAIDPDNHGSIKGAITIKAGPFKVTVNVELINSADKSGILPSLIKVDPPNILMFNLQQMTDDYLKTHPLSEEIKKYLQKMLAERQKSQRQLQKVGLHINPDTKTLDGEIV